MPLPRKPFATIADVAEHLGCSQHTLVQWAAAEMITVQVPVTSTEFAGLPLNGMVTVTGTDLLKAFPSHGLVKKKCLIQRVYCAVSGEWGNITTPEGGLVVSTRCLMISVDQVCKFQRDHNVRREIAPPTEPVPTEPEPPKPRRRGRKTKHPWDDFHNEMTRHIHRNGLPESQAELVRIMMLWFERRAKTAKDLPDLRTVERKIEDLYLVLGDGQPDD